MFNVGDTIEVKGGKQHVVSDVEVAAVRKVLAYIDANFAGDCTLAAVAKVGGYSPFHLHRMVQLIVGKTVKRLAAEKQVELAKRLMSDGLSLKDVAHACGFSHQSHFTSRFKKVTGQTPGRWLRLRRMETTAV